MAGMERFTQRARRVLSIAHREAEYSQSNVIGIEHLLLGLIDEDGGVACRVLRELGVRTENLHEIVKGYIIASLNFSPDHIELGAETQNALEYAVDEAHKLNHHYIGTEHILLGIMRLDSVAIKILNEFSVTKEKIRNQINLVLSESKSQVKEPEPQQIYLWRLSESNFSSEIVRYIEEIGYKPVFIKTNNDNPEANFLLLQEIAGRVDFAFIYISPSDTSFFETNVNNNYLNSIYQMGFFHAKLGQKRVCVLFDSKINKKVNTFLGLTNVDFLILGDDMKWKDTLYNKMVAVGMIPKTN